LGKKEGGCYSGGVALFLRRETIASTIAVTDMPVEAQGNIVREATAPLSFDNDLMLSSHRLLLP